MKPEKIVWNEALSIGNEQIDEDHLEILKIYNDLIDIINGKGNFDEFARVLTDMTNYAFKHFDKEEIYMNKINYPYRDSHTQIHRNYIYKVSMFNLNYFENTNIDDVLNFIKDWWHKHIQGADAEYEKYRISNQIEAFY
jgi:hemerythrin